MRTIADCLENATHFEQMAAQAADLKTKARLLHHAAAYRNMANSRTQKVPSSVAKFGRPLSWGTPQTAAANRVLNNARQLVTKPSAPLLCLIPHCVNKSSIVELVVDDPKDDAEGKAKPGQRHGMVPTRT